MSGRRAREARKAKRAAEAAAPGLGTALARLRADRHAAVADMRRRRRYAKLDLGHRYAQMLKARPRAPLGALNDDARKALQLIEDRFHDMHVGILEHFGGEEEKLLRADARAA